MNSQPANTHSASSPDARIDQVLHALRTTEAPAGLEQRIAARLAQAAEARTLTTSCHSAASSHFAFILTLRSLKGKVHRVLLASRAKRYTVAAGLMLLLALTAVTFLRHRAAATSARSTPIGIAPSSGATCKEAPHPSRHQAPAQAPALAAEAISTPHPPSAQDPDAIALAETLAPSRPAPPLPLTPQEHLMLAAMRPGQPIQLAELDTARAPFLRVAAAARETASIDRYVRRLLAPVALADALQPTTFFQPQEAPTPPPPPPSNSSN